MPPSVAAAGFLEGAPRLGLWILELVIILALGESITGIGAAHSGMARGFATAAILAVALSAALWWMYFDDASAAARQRLGEVHEEDVLAWRATRTATCTS